MKYFKVMYTNRNSYAIWRDTPNGSLKCIGGNEDIFEIGGVYNPSPNWPKCTHEAIITQITKDEAFLEMV
tara:strand:+ start:209 stop:418 length:210 start_codon:yes stop_codon:yes gene_type:complete